MLPQQIYEQAKQTPEKPALFADGRGITYRAFAALIDRTRGYLAGRDLPAEGVAVLPWCSNGTVWVLGLALRSLGLTTIIVPTANSIGGSQILGARCLVAVAGEHPPDLDQLCAATGLPLIDVPSEIYAGASQAAVPNPPEPGFRCGGHILLTSGTTGAYKQLLLEPWHQAAQSEFRRKVFGIDARSVVNTLSLGGWTSGGFNFAMATWDAGGTVVIDQRAKFWSSLLVPGITHCLMFPQLLLEMLSAPPEELQRNEAMVLMTTGAGLSEASADAAKARLASRLCNYIGATEASAYTLTFIETVEDLIWHRVIPSRKVEVVDAQGRVLPHGRTGLVRVDLAVGPAGYLGDDAATQLFFRDGWFYPADLGVFRADGRLALRGRANDVINILGIKIASGPIERMLERELGVTGACVFSAPGKGAEDWVHVAIETEAPLDKARLAGVVRRELPAAPRVRVSLLPRFPRNDLGKVQRIALRRQIVGD